MGPATATRQRRPLGTVRLKPELREVPREADLTVGAQLHIAAGLLCLLADALEAHDRLPIDERKDAVVEARGRAIEAALEVLPVVARKDAPELRWILARLRLPQAGACRRDADALRAMVSRAKDVGE